MLVTFPAPARPRALQDASKTLQNASKDAWDRPRRPKTPPNLPWCLPNLDFERFLIDFWFIFDRILIDFWLFRRISSWNPAKFGQISDWIPPRFHPDSPRFHNADDNIWNLQVITHAHIINNCKHLYYIYFDTFLFSISKGIKIRVYLWPSASFITYSYQLSDVGLPSLVILKVAAGITLFFYIGHPLAKE